jgi:general nucleoside transport system permease protein
MNSTALTVGGTDRMREIAAALGLTLLVAALCAVLLAVTGVNPLRAYLEIVRGAFGSPNAIAECLVYATPITLTALSVILCFRCGLWNIGADGQLYIGAIAAVGVGFNTMNLPGALVLPGMLVAGFAAGAAYAAIPAFLRLRFGSSEVIVTIMMNFLAATFAIYLIGGPWASGITPATGPIVSSGVLPIIIPGTRLSAGFIIALLAAAILSRVLSSSVFGFQVRTIGQNINAAWRGWRALVK